MGGLMVVAPIYRISWWVDGWVDEVDGLSAVCRGSLLGIRWVREWMSGSVCSPLSIHPAMGVGGG